MYSKFLLLSIWIRVEIMVSTIKASPDLYDKSVKSKRGLEQNQKITMLTEAGCNINGTLLVKGVCIDDDYNKEEPPRNDTIINFLFYHFEFLRIYEKEKRIRIEVQWWEFWEDNRIKTNGPSLANNNLSGDPIKIRPLSVWFPRDSWKIDKTVKTTNLKSPPTSVSIINTHFYSNRTALMREQNYEFILTCRFDFSDYPLDVQHCQYRIMNYLTDLWLRLLNTTFLHNVDQRRMYGGFDITITFMDGNRTETAEESYFTVNIRMERIISPFLFQYYLPCAAIVVVSQVSFIIPPSSIPGRIGLVTTQFLTLTNIFIAAMVRQ